MKKTSSDIRKFYVAHYTKLYAIERSRLLANELWDQWENGSISRPDVNAVANSVSEINESFFREIVNFCTVHQSPPLGEVLHCAVGLNDYNFRKITSEDGCLVLADEAFQRLLFILSMSLVFLTRTELTDKESEWLMEWNAELIERWFVQNQDFDLPKSSNWEKIAAKSYETAEMGVYLFNAMHAFILAHEIGHHALKHNSSSTNMRTVINGIPVELEVDQQSHQEEYDADGYAFSAYSRMHEIKDGSNPLCFFWWYPFAPILLFDIFVCLESLIQPSGADSSTHPHPNKRRERLVEQNAEILDDQFYLDLRGEMTQIFALIRNDRTT